MWTLVGTKPHSLTSFDIQSVKTNCEHIRTCLKIHVDSLARTLVDNLVGILWEEFCVKVSQLHCWMRQYQDASAFPFIGFGKKQMLFPLHMHFDSPYEFRALEVYTYSHRSSVKEIIPLRSTFLASRF